MKCFDCIALMLFVVFIATGCSKSTEVVVVETRLEPFRDIWLHDVFYATLVQGPASFVRVSGDEKTVENINFYIEDGILHFENQTVAKWLQPKTNKLSLEIHSPHFEVVTASQTCYIENVDTIFTPFFKLVQKSKLNEANLTVVCNKFVYSSWPSCGGETIINGKTGMFRCINRGIMVLRAEGFIADSAVVKQSSKADCRIHAQQKLTYSIYNVGNIILYGHPETIIADETESSGRLIKME